MYSWIEKPIQNFQKTKKMEVCKVSIACHLRRFMFPRYSINKYNKWNLLLNFDLLKIFIVNLLPVKFEEI